MLIASIAAIALFALAAPLAHGAWRRGAGPLLALGVGSVFARLAWVAPDVTAGAVTLERFAWAPQLGLEVALRLDGLALLMSLLITGVGAVVLLFASASLRDHPALGRFYATLLAFMASMLGLVLADNALLAFVFWELTSITSYLLIGLDHHRAEARKAATQALLTTGAGGLALLAGLVTLCEAAGTYQLSELVTRAEVLDHPALTPAIALILAGCFTKSAQFPFWAWLPGAMEAPTAVSAYLHSSTMVKAGVYLIARLSPLLSGVALWDSSLVVVGAATALGAAFVGSRQTYFKRVLAYSTVSSLGTMVMLLGLGAGGATAAAVFLLAHALYKGALFLVAGVVDHATHVKDSERLGALWRSLPITATAAALAGLSMAGVPGLLGFAGKELWVKESLHALQGGWTPWLIGAVAGAGALNAAMAAQVALRPFWLAAPSSAGAHAPAKDPAHAHGPAWPLWIGPALMALAGLIGGVSPGLFAAPVALAAADAIAGLSPGAPGAADVPLDVGHLVKPGPALYLSLGAAAAGLAVFALRRAYRAATRPASALDPLGPQSAYAAAYSGVLGTAQAITRVTQNGSLHFYLRVTLGFVSVVGWGTLWRAWAGASEPIPRTPVGPIEAALVAGTAVSVAAMVLLRTRLAVIAALGAAGYCVASLFAVYGAPDLAMTQFAVETLSVVLLVLVLYHLPRFPAFRLTAARVVDAAIALSVGALMSGLVLLAAGVQLAEPVSAYFSQNASALANGRNVVNVIIVDFRALDTLGEITVLAIAALGVLALLDVRAERPGPRASAPGQPADAHPNPAHAPADGALAGRAPTIGGPA